MRCFSINLVKTSRMVEILYLSIIKYSMNHYIIPFTIILYCILYIEIHISYYNIMVQIMEYQAVKPPLSNLNLRGPN